jgi:hypothetical protein
VNALFVAAQELPATSSTFSIVSLGIDNKTTPFGLPSGIPPVDCPCKKLS